MNGSHNLKQLLSLWLLLAFVGTSIFLLKIDSRLIASAQSSAAAQGIALYKAGNIREAITALRAAVKQNEQDADAWHYLGLALLGNGSKKNARSSFERAARLRVNNLYVKYPSPSLSEEEKASRRLEAAARVKNALDSVEQYIALTSNPGEEWLTELQNLRVNKEYYETGWVNERLVPSNELTTKARVISKPEPTYTKEAREHGKTGTVILRAIFSYDGTVKNIVVVKGLRYGLNERAIDAARQIKFIPAVKDGKPVSMWMQLEYNFNLY